MTDAVAAQPAAYDLVIEGGVVIDGMGGPPRRADVGVIGDRIAAVGDLRQAPGGRRIPAEGRRVAPGFIDIHTHSDISVAYNRPMASMVSQGVTTQVAGNCALSIGMSLDSDIFSFERRWLASHGVRIRWTSLAEHFQFVADGGVATNYLLLAGQGTLRKLCVGLDNRAPTSDEMTRMQSALSSAMSAGAWGLSTGLEYTPSGYANVDELTALARVAGEFGGFYATHLRNEGDRLAEAVQEALDVGVRASLPVQLSHHKAEGRQNWGKVARTLAMVDRARRDGVDVCMDQYPYRAFQTSMAVQFLPAWANEGDLAAVVQRATDPALRERVVGHMLAEHPEWADPAPDGYWGGVLLPTCRSDRSLQGKTLAEIGRLRAKHPAEIVLDLICAEGGYVSAVNFAIDEADIATVMRHPHTMIGSDAVGTAPEGTMGADQVHPRCYGTFARVLGRYVREQATLEESEAVMKMTSMPANRLGISDRGRISPGAFADLVIYNAATVEDRATFENPHAFSAGIETVLVNGTSVWSSGAVTGALPGRVLRKGR